MITGWIYEENLKPLFEILAQIVGYNFDDSDWTAVSTGIRNTNDEREEWYEYDLIGVQRINVEVAEDISSSIIHIRLQCEPSIEEKVRVATSIFQQYRLT